MRQYFGDRNNGANNDFPSQQDDPNTEAIKTAATPSTEEKQVVMTTTDSTTTGKDGSSSDQERRASNAWRRLRSTVLKVSTPGYCVHRLGCLGDGNTPAFV